MLNFVIFQAPTLSHLVDTRINNAIFFQKKAFEMMQSASEVLYTRQSTWAEGEVKPENEGCNVAQTNELDFIFELAEKPITTHEVQNGHAVDTGLS